jgi:hypothetical protein
MFFLVLIMIAQNKLPNLFRFGIGHLTCQNTLAGNEVLGSIGGDAHFL